MALPPYTSKDELDASGAPVVPLEPVAAVAPNRGTENVASSLDYLAALQRVHQTLSFGTAPRMEWDDASRVLTLGGDLVVRYVVDDPTSTLPVIRSTTLKSGSYSFGTNTMVFIPLGFDADVEITAGGTVTPPSAGSLAYFKDDGEAQQFFRADTSANGRQNALKYIQFGRKAGTSLQVLGKVALRNGAPVEDFRDEEYAGDTVTQQTRRFINQDRNLMMYGAGEATFALSGSDRTMTTVSDLELVTANGTRTTVTGLVSGVTLTATNPVLAVTLNRTLGSVAVNPAAATNFSALSSDNTDLTMLGFWDEVQDVFRWRDGSGYKPGTAHTIGLCCDFTPSFLIERILPELVFATDTAANTFLGGIGTTDRVVMVVDDGPNAPRDQIRFATQDSINVGLAQETIRAYGISQQRIFATDASVAGPDVVKVRDAGDAADGSMSMESAHVNTLRNLGGSASGDLEVRGPSGVVMSNVRAFDVVSMGAFSGAKMISPSLPAGKFDFEGSALSADDARVEAKAFETEIIYCDNASGALEIRDDSSPNPLFPIQASQGLFEEFVRVDGSGLSEPQVRASGSEVAFRDAAGGPVVDVRAKDVRAHDLLLFDDTTVPGSTGDVLLQAESPNSTVAGENALIVAGPLGALSPVCAKVGGQLGSVEVQNVRVAEAVVPSNQKDYVRVADHTDADERDIWARDLYLNSTGSGTGAIYFDTPATPTPLARLTSGATSLLRWEVPSTGDLQRIAAFALELSRAGSLSTTTSRLSALEQTDKSLGGATGAGTLGETVRVGDVSGGLSLLETEAVGSTNTACVTGRFTHNTGNDWLIDGVVFTLGTQAPFRPRVVFDNSGSVFLYVETSQTLTVTSTSWTYSAQFLDTPGGVSYPVTAVLRTHQALSSPDGTRLGFQFYHAANGAGLSAGGTSVAGDLISDIDDLRRVTFCLDVHSPDADI